MLQYRNDIILSFDLVYAEPILCEEELRIHGKSGVQPYGRYRLICQIFFCGHIYEFTRSIGKIGYCTDSILGER